jgi:hypothetical protein
MMLREIIPVYTEKHTKPVSTNFSVTVSIRIPDSTGTYSYHWALNTDDRKMDTSLCKIY